MLQRRLIETTVIQIACALLLATGQPNDVVTLKGCVVDNLCARAMKVKEQGLAKAKRHPRSCAIMGQCLKSGFALLTEEGSIYKFDEAGCKRVLEVFRASKGDVGLMVTVKGTIDGDVIHADSIDEIIEKQP